MSRATLAIVPLMTVLCSASTALADDDKKANEFVIDSKKDAKDKKKEKKKDGLEWKINGGATLNFTDNRQVVGQVDGSSFTFGFKFDAGATYRKSDHEWRNNLAILAGVTRTPALDEFVKTQDNLEAESVYLYHVTDWFGPFARLGWQTPMFRGTDVRPEPTQYVIAREDGTSDSVTASRLTLTDAMSPSRLKESIGLFAQPVAKEPINVEARIGAGGRHVFADGQLALIDDEDTPVVEVDELADVHQVGAEAVVEVWGAFENKRFTYNLGAEAMTPLWNNLPATDERNAFELTNLLFRAGLSFKMVEWASVDYQFRAVREPQLLDKFQIQNQMLLTFGVGAGGGPGVEAKAKKK